MLGSSFTTKVKNVGIQIWRLQGGSKVCCSSEEGLVCIFSWGDFGDYSDRFTDIKTGINALVRKERVLNCVVSLASAAACAATKKLFLNCLLLMH